MVWNCPHCRAALALSDELLGSSWNMSRCPNCENSGFIRRPGNLAIKVDQVPEGEKVLIAKSILKPSPLPGATSKIAGPKITRTAEGKTPWPVTPLQSVRESAAAKPVIRRAVLRNRATALAASAAETKAPSAIQSVAQAVKNATVVVKAEEPTRMVQLKPETIIDDSGTRMITPPEFTREVLSDSALIDKTALKRNFEIPKLPMMIAVGHTVKGERRKNAQDADTGTNTKIINFPEALPELPPEPTGLTGLLSEVSALVPTVAFLVISGLVGWNAVRYVQGSPEPVHHEIVDHLSQHAMAPTRANRALKDLNIEKYSDDPTQVRARSTEVQAYTGPGADFSASGVLQPGHLYSVLEKNGNWVKFALDQAHPAWVNIAGVDLIH
jgi:hypothetical protein